MADPRQRHPQNVPGPWFVDRTCIDCDVSRQCAPWMFGAADGQAIVVRQKIWPKLDKVTIESPPLHCVTKGKPYAVSIAIEDAGGATLQTLKTTITSSEDQDRLPDAPLVVGPAYTPNPELSGHPDGKLPGSSQNCPA